MPLNSPTGIGKMIHDIFIDDCAIGTFKLQKDESQLQYVSDQLTRQRYVSLLGQKMRGFFEHTCHESSTPCLESAIPHAEYGDGSEALKNDEYESTWE
jgi:hypothetical protein